MDAAVSFTDAGLETRERIEALTDELAAPVYDVLSADELDELTAGSNRSPPWCRLSTTDWAHPATAMPPGRAAE
ncbi:hypothetical protein [Amycolatopsis sp. DG1A-15b]|uniref:helix-turn-helix domain-containing protein n=1 Tax=Amycolatopsis sp. DG1A-15b TaxID=3052846 RepID=UPI00255BF33A|nr:hypothetical protein [Amycolatopsis sp. DG1A-15b]WIX92771.1 hypothetical protein QRY02_20930 [Amycolatopsis sp. DG1A-15b]